MPTLARLSFWVPPERMDTFEATYKKKLVPILTKHDLEESSERGRKTVEGVFSRLFEVETPSEVAVKERTLRNDPAWQEALWELGAALETAEPDGLLRAHFGIYRTPTGPGKKVDAGPGYPTPAGTGKAETLCVHKDMTIQPNVRSDGDRRNEPESS